MYQCNITYLGPRSPHFLVLVELSRKRFIEYFCNEDGVQIKYLVIVAEIASLIQIDYMDVKAIQVETGNFQL